MRPLHFLFAVALAAGCTADNTDFADAGMSLDLSGLPASGDLGAAADAGEGADGSTDSDGGAGADGGPSDAGPSCVPKNIPCGNCGTIFVRCDADGGTHTSICMQEGECKPGTTEPYGNCRTRTCGMDCKWGSYMLKPGAMCGDGTSQTCKSSDPFCHMTGHQQCDKNTCTWGPCRCI